MKISKEKISIIKIIISNNYDAVNMDDDRCSSPQKRKRFFDKTKNKK